MPASEYKNTISGGLKLKGAKDAGVSKPKKKKSSGSKSKSKDTGKDEGRDAEMKPVTGEAREGNEGSRAETEERDADASDLQKALANEDADDLSFGPVSGGVTGGAGKTETQRRHEETRRKRLDERLRKEGVKTHKERVEELNKYLSTLSEHHDMPRIGPG